MSAFSSPLGASSHWGGGGGRPAQAAGQDPKMSAFSSPLGTSSHWGGGGGAQPRPQDREAFMPSLSLDSLVS